RLADRLLARRAALLAQGLEDPRLRALRQLAGEPEQSGSQGDRPLGRSDMGRNDDRFLHLHGRGPRIDGVRAPIGATMTNRLFASVCAPAIAGALAWLLISSGMGPASAQAPGSAKADTRKGATAPRTPWGDPDLQGTWTSEGELGIPFERAAEFGTRQLLTDEEFVQRQRQSERQLQTDNADF